MTIKPTNDARGQPQYQFPFKLKGLCVIEPSSQEIRSVDATCPEMIQIGNRQCLISAVLSLFGSLDKNGINLKEDSNTRLQRDISELLEIINTTDSYNFPFITANVFKIQSAATSFLQHLNYSPALVSSSNSAISSLDLQFKFISCTYTIQNVRGQTFKYLRFKSSEIRHSKNPDNGDLYTLPTGQNGISAFFIKYDGLKDELLSELKRSKTDLFYKLEDLFTSMHQEKEGTTELWVPAFNKRVS